MAEKRGFSLIDGTYITLIVLAFVLMSVRASHILEASLRSPVSRAKADQCSLAIGLEAYKIDHQNYPSVLGGRRFELSESVLTTPVAYMSSSPPDCMKTHTLLTLKSHPFLYIHNVYRLTIWAAAILIVTSFISMLFVAKTWSRKRRITVLILYPLLLLFPIFVFDSSESQFHTFQAPEWRNGYQGFNYYTDGKTYCILQSVGWDGRRDLLDLDKVPFDPKHPDKAHQFLSQYEYDPTNGISSTGDFFRVIP
jgi:hypothetical protein